MSKELVFGHQNPDTDAIVAAMAFAYLQQQLGKDVEAVALGEPNEETSYALRHFAASTPRVIKEAGSEVQSVMLVDHNEAQQSVADIKDLTVTDVVDHHRIANFETVSPLFYRAEAVGCTSTILLSMFNENKIEIPAQLAGLMMSAIISDTLLMKSPTTTEKDRIAIKTLAEIADVDFESYGLEMLKAGTNLDDKSEAELIEADAKTFDMAGKKVRIDQVNTVDIEAVFKRQAAFEAAIEADNKANGYDLFVLLITDILNSNSEALVIGEPAEAFEKAFDVTLNNHRAQLAGVVSRKKQVVPQLTAAF